VAFQHSAVYKVEKEDHSAKARIVKLWVSGKKILAPVLWLGHRVGGDPKPWKVFSLPGVLMNAWDILSTGQTSKKIREAGIEGYLNLETSCATFLDSGGYLYLKQGKINLDPLEILSLYEDSTPTIGAILDYPLDPFVSIKVNKKRWQRTLENTRLMFERNGCLTLMPVIHAHSVAQAKKACTDLREIVGEPVVLGVGSLVPLMRVHRGKLAVEIIKVVRAEFPKTFLHAFGVGGTTTMHFMFALGVDSLDSVGWRLKAGYGAIQLPGLGDRFTGNRRWENRTLLIEDEKAKRALLSCRCPICQEHSTVEKRLKALDKSFNNRALHNAWVFVQEAATFRRQVETDSVEPFVSQRLQHSPLKSLLPAIFGQL